MLWLHIGESNVISIEINYVNNYEKCCVSNITCNNIYISYDSDNQLLINFNGLILITCLVY